MRRAELITLSNGGKTMSEKNKGAAVPQTQKLNYKRTFLIGLGFMACMLLWSVYNSYVPVILKAKFTELFAEGGGIEAFHERVPALAWLSVPLIVNAIMTIDNIFGVIFQPFFGKKSDATKSKFGKRMPYIIIGLPICAVFFSFIPVVAFSVKAIILSIALMMAVVICFNFVMSVWRSPVVSLMPDFTPSNLQSDANAVINIMGGIGQVFGFVIGTIVSTLAGLFGLDSMAEMLKAKTNTLGQILATDEAGNVIVKALDKAGQLTDAIYNVPAELADKYKIFLEGKHDVFTVNGVDVAQKQVLLVDGVPQYVNYTPIFVVAALIAVLCLVALVAFYKKNKKYDLSAAVEIETAEGEKPKKIKIRDLPITKEEKRSLLTMLLALFLICNATEAIIPNFTNFAEETLAVSPIYSTLMMAAFAVSLAAFGIPAGTLGRKIGRKKTIIIGLIGCIVFFGLYLAVSQIFGNQSKVTWICFWIAIITGGACVGMVNINTLPLVLAIGGRELVGTFTGYYYTATFSAAVSGPILCGLLIGLFDNDYNFMFLFCAIAFVLGLLVMTRVKHGEVSKEEDTSWLDEAVQNADD